DSMSECQSRVYDLGGLMASNSETNPRLAHSRRPLAAQLGCTHIGFFPAAPGPPEGASSSHQMPTARRSPPVIEFATVTAVSLRCDGSVCRPSWIACTLRARRLSRAASFLRKDRDICGAGGRGNMENR